MSFKRIDMNTWNRKESYTHYFNNVPCTYSMTVNLDVTKLMDRIKSHNLKFFPTILYGITHVVNNYKEFRMDLDEQGNVGYYDYSNPCYTVFHNETETFTDVWTEYSTDYTQFIKNYTEDMHLYQNDCKNSKPIQNGNVFNVSCIPWTSFTGFNLNLQKGYDYFPPIFTIGKYFNNGDQLLLPLAIQVNHAICDGFHLSRFIDALQKCFDDFIL